VNVEDRTLAIIAHQSGRPIEDITRDRRLDEAPIDLDSLDRIELAMVIEDEFRIEIPDEDVDRRDMATVGGLVDYVKAKAGA
jgi:acyl carrier protein